MRKIFITGATGYIGKRLLFRLVEKSSNVIYCLTRQSIESMNHFPNSPQVHIIQGSLLDNHVYGKYLKECDIVIHLAAITGKARNKDYYRINADGTKRLVDESSKSGIHHFIYVSSIATTFKSISNYYYAQTKKIGELALKQSKLAFTILRPSIVIGYESASWKNLSKLVRGPFPIMFGKGKVKIQPIFIDDLIDCLILAIDIKSPANEIIDLGGPQAVNFDQFIKIMHQQYHGGKYPVFHIPLKPIMVFLEILEKFLYEYLPINLGQLTPFINDSVTKKNRLQRTIQSKMYDVNRMIDSVVYKEELSKKKKQLFRECRVFCRYLIQQEPNNDVIEHYRNAHEKIQDMIYQKVKAFDLTLLSIARWDPFGTRMVDAYTSVFGKKTIIRKKLILMLAILECIYPYYEILDTPTSKKTATVILNASGKAVSHSFNLLLSTLLLGPLHLLYQLQTKKNKNTKYA